ncbi:MAG TPA: hypothetical protein VIO64_14725 [Pseudobacteroides sp.]|uniref:hypothetical protein n=1 Tax=Pseudobacteroides sp. TaxID=1968840 RepID=UPI002F9438F8
MIRRATKDYVFILSNLWAKMSNGLIGSVYDACSPASDAYEEINNLLMNKHIHFVLFEKNQIINGFFLGWLQEKDFYYFKDDYCYIFVSVKPTVS